MAQLMGQHGGHLIGAGDGTDQPQMHAKIATRQGKGIDAAVADQKHVPGKAFVQFRRQLAPRAGSGHQRLPDALQIIHQHRVIDVVRVAVKADGDAVANAAFCRSRKLGIVAQRRQRTRPLAGTRRRGLRQRERRCRHAKRHYQRQRARYGRGGFNSEQGSQKQSLSGGGWARKQALMMTHRCKGSVSP